MYRKGLQKDGYFCSIKVTCKWCCRSVLADAALTEIWFLIKLSLASICSDDESAGTIACIIQTNQNYHNRRANLATTPSLSFPNIEARGWCSQHLLEAYVVVLSKKLSSLPWSMADMRLPFYCHHKKALQWGTLTIPKGGLGFVQRYLYLLGFLQQCRLLLQNLVPTLLFFYLL